MTNAEVYLTWLADHDVASADRPNRQRLFRKGKLLCTLPFLRAYWKIEQGQAPLWEKETWQPIGEGVTRFLRADQVLDWIISLLPDDEPEKYRKSLVKEIQSALLTWLVPVKEPLAWRDNILARRVEAVRVRSRGGRLLWSRRAGSFPDEMRQNVPGMDPVHTPENDRAGLTRYLCDGWYVDDQGRLDQRSGATHWGPSTSRIPRRLHNTPRRLMLAASLQSRAVDLLEPDPPGDRVLNEGWNPPGRDLRAAFSAFNGSTHEDAIVLSESAAKALARNDAREVRVDIPAVASRIEVLVKGGDLVRQGDTLARAFIDLFALGWRRHEADRLGAEDGWLEIALPDAVATDDERLVEVRRRTIRTLKLREHLTFRLEKHAPVRIGDKLSTRHGIKGVVSKVLNDSEMPPDGDDPSQIVLSPVGMARRGAMGQFREADAGATTPPPSGRIFVMRQPQDAHMSWSVHGTDRSIVRGTERLFVRGQRYGEMEFWALMAHGAPEIAHELLAVARASSRWMLCESETEGGDGRTLATRALNRYLAVVNAKIDRGRLVGGARPESFDIHCNTYSQLKQAWEILDDEEAFASRGGLGALSFAKPVKLEIAGRPLELEKAYVIPPWLRPATRRGRHELTKAYRNLLFDFWMGRSIKCSLEQCVRIVLEAPHEQPARGDAATAPATAYVPTGLGVMAFLRREALGRRLNRSARAVIVPRPALRIDEIAVPRFIAEIIFAGLPERSTTVVLVNRNPTLHRRGLLALRPVIEESTSPVFGLPLGVLQVLGADFDGDQATVVALETVEALAAAERLLPGASALRLDPFRPGHPAFPLLHELSAPAEEARVAANTGHTQPEWCAAHYELLQASVGADPDGWIAAQEALKEKRNKNLWEGLDETDWLQIAEKEMRHVYKTVRKKGQFGGALRRELYRQDYTDQASFYAAVAALQAVTERLVQTALSVKTGESLAAFDAEAFFEDPASGASEKSLRALDPTLDYGSVGRALGTRSEPTGLLEWLARPTAGTLLNAIASSHDKDPAAAETDDPRVSWFLE